MLPKPVLFDLAPERMQRRVRAPLTPWEFFALLFAFGIAIAFVYIDAAFQAQSFPDYRTFMDATRGDFGGFFYGFWVLPVLHGFALLPEYVGYLLWSALNILGVWFAARVFNSSIALAVLSYQMLYVLFYGNIAGIIVGALGVLWWSLHRRRLLLAGVAFIAACTKVQLGLPLALAVLLLAPLSLRDKARVLVIPALVVLASFALYGNWILTLWEWSQRVAPNTAGSISPWRWFGPLALVVWIPVLLAFLPGRGGSAGARLALVAAATALGIPYFQQTDLLALFALPVAALPLVGNLGYLFVVFAWAGFAPLVIVPVIGYALAIRKLTRNSPAP